MKKSKKQPVNIFTGKFKVMRLYCNVRDQGWILFKRYGHKSFIWEFPKTERLVFPSGSVAYQGQLIELRKDCEPFITEYAYYPGDEHLYIDRSDIADDGFINICVNDRYRVEKINDKDYWLYDLEDVDKEPEDYRFRMILRKL